MMKNRIFSLLVSGLFLSSVMAQSTDPIVLTVDNQNITKSEFLRVYKKNNAQAGTDLKSLTDYMDLFINFKLKVVEAEHLGYDTVNTFVSEYQSYKDQLAKPYLTDNAVEEKLVRDAYERMKYEMRARMIYIKCNQFTAPSDTIIAYNRAIEARNKLLKGEPWDSICLKYSTDDMSKTKGDMGYFTAFQTIYAFESKVFNLNINDISMPIRTPYGYNLVQCTDKRASRGELKVAHIMIAFPENAEKNSIDSARIKIFDLYNRLKAGENFEKLAKQYSDDKRSGDKGGELNWFSTGQMIPEFENAAFALQKNGDISAPMRTSFGWHIIKRLENRPISSFEDLKESIKPRILRDDRLNYGKYAVIEKIKKEIGFKDYPEKYAPLYKLLDSTFFQNKWSASKAEPLKNEILFVVNNQKYSVYDFATFMVKKNKYNKPFDISVLCSFMYKDFVNDKIINFEKSRLEQKYPDYKFLLQEYHDGILLFNLMEEKIWNAAARDSIGLEKFYKDSVSLYKWGERVDALVATSPKKELVDLAYTKANDYLAGKVTFKDILKLVCKDDTTLKCMNISEVLFEKGDNNILDSLGWEKGITPIVFRDNKYGFFIKKGTKPAEQKTYEDAKGTVIADYQAFLEQKYLAELKKKYKVVINDKVLESISKEGQK